ncbi:hypothetical protein [Thomasclavelia cocleata]|uniref:hypothetical protein n=1 Tax=Thomasclavelia cocleata TaxID=69824 RepID=UPI00242EC1F3|nr:hypothetical protein [Thomasclavelia cocleata]
MREDAIINGKSILREYGLKMVSFNITPPTPKTEIIEIPYSNIYYDVSEIFGEVTYKPRTITMVFRLITDINCWHTKIDALVNDLHGKKVEIKLLSDGEWSYNGRCEVTIATKDSYYDSSITISALVEPYKTNSKGDKKL